MKWTLPTTASFWIALCATATANAHLPHGHNHHGDHAHGMVHEHEHGHEHGHEHHHGHDHSHNYHGKNHHGHNNLRHEINDQVSDDGSEREPAMLPHTHVAYHHVEQACRQDLDRLCSTGLQHPLFILEPAPVSRISGAPPAPPSSMMEQDDPFASMEQFMREMDRILDHTINVHHQAILVVGDDSSGHGDSVHVFSSVGTDQSLPPPPPPAGLMGGSDPFLDMVVNDLVMTMLMVQPPPNEPMPIIAQSQAQAPPPCDEELPKLAEGLQQYGKQVLADQAEGSAPDAAADTKVHVARRLSEVTTRDLERLRQKLRLPFTKDERMCLAQNYRQLSSKCARSIHIFREVAEGEIKYAKEQSEFCSLLWVYIALVSVLMVFVVLKFQKRAPKRILKRLILQAVYDNPDLKRSVEADLGVGSIGSRPPMKNLDSEGDGGNSCRYNLKTAMIFVIFALVFIAPNLVLPICIGITATKVIRLAHYLFVSDGEDGHECNNRDNDHKEGCCCCCCCCDNGSPDSEAGVKECCDMKCCDKKCCGDGCCCCCNNDDAADGCCCGTTCCECCSKSTPEPKGRGEKHRIQAEVAVFQGVPVRVV